MTIFRSDEQILLIPTVGFVRGDNGAIWLTIAFLSFGITFKIFTYGT